MSYEIISVAAYRWGPGWSKEGEAISSVQNQQT